MIKDPTNSVLAQRSDMLPIVVLAQFESLSVLSKPTNIKEVDVGISMEFEIGNKKGPLIRAHRVRGHQLYLV